MDSAIPNNTREEIILLWKQKPYLFLKKLYFFLKSDSENLSKNMNEGSHCSDSEVSLMLTAVLFFQVLASSTVYLLVIRSVLG